MIHFVVPLVFFTIFFLSISMSWFYIQTTYKDNSILTLKQKIIGASLLTISVLLLISLVMYGMFYDINSYQLVKENKKLQLLGVMVAFFFGIIVPMIIMIIIEKKERTT